MLDIQLLRNDIQTTAQRLAQRGFVLDTERFGELEGRRKQLQIRSEELQAQRNSLSKQIGVLMGQGKKDEAEAAKAQVAQLKTDLENIESELPQVQAALDDLLLRIPNLPHESVPVGKDETENVEVRKVGTPKTFDFEVKDHVDLGAALGLDFEKAAELSGARFSLMKGKVARLHRALAQFMLDTHTQQHGYTECYTPYIVSDAALLGTGQLPKFAEDLFHVTRGGDESKLSQYLIPTAEVTLINNRQSVIPAMVAESGVRTLVYGRGETLDLRYFPVSAELKEGDLLVTSGIDSIYPAGIPIAKVVSADRNSGTPYYRTVLTPAANLSSSNYVLVIPQKPQAAVRLPETASEPAVEQETQE